MTGARSVFAIPFWKDKRTFELLLGMTLPFLLAQKYSTLFAVKSCFFQSFRVKNLRICLKKNN